MPRCVAGASLPSAHAFAPLWASDVAAELVAHGRQQLLGEGVVLRASGSGRRARPSAPRPAPPPRSPPRPSSGPRRNPRRRRRSPSSSGSSASAIAVRSSSQETIDAAAPPHLGDVGEVEVEALRPPAALVESRVAQDVEALGIGLHQAVFDAVVDHLDEVAGAARAAVEVALLGARIAALAARRARRSSPGPGASAAKIGSRCSTASLSPPIIMQ